MFEKVQGGCMCGAIRYELNDEPLATYYCHCNDCKKSTGSAFHVGLVMKLQMVNIMTGIPKEYTKTSDSGNLMTRCFCENCGSPLFTKDSGAPHNLVIKAGSLDQLTRVFPTTELWTIRKVPWATIGPNIESKSKGKAYQI